MSARTIVIAGAGIGGLTAALALAEKGFRVALLDKAEQLEQTGAGIQLTPNATRILIALGLRERLAPAVVVPTDIRVKTRRNREITRIPLGASTEARFGAPYWIIHRGDLQAALLGAVRAHPDITLELGAEVDGFAIHANGITVQSIRNARPTATHAIALVGADGLWSSLRTRLGHPPEPRFAHRTAWRATVPADAVAVEFREPAVYLWLGRHSHLVHYPVKAGAMINIVAIATDKRQGSGWSTAAAPQEVASRFSQWFWANEARELLSVPKHWLRWPLYDRPPSRQWGRGPVTLLGDAAHPMLPFLAQGAAMAIEDAAVLADWVGKIPADIEGAMRQYERTRRPRTRRAQRAARQNGLIYHLGWPESAIRNLVLRAMGGERLLGRYNWIYDWRAG